MPLRRRWLLAPGMTIAALGSILLLLAHGVMILALLFGVIVPSLGSSWAGRMVDNPLLGMLLQFGLLLVALLVMLLLLKPLLSLRLPSAPGLAIHPGNEPDLYAFVADICERIQAPVPSRILLDTTPTLVTRYDQGASAWLRGQVVLTLGVPLLATMNCSQLAALIAQAMNRYRGKYLPPLNSLLLAIQTWLQTALHQPDWLDRYLQRLQEQGRLGESVLAAVQWFLGLSRWPLWLWLYLSQWLAFRYVHRLVADSDKMALAFAGSEGYLRQMDQYRLMTYSHAKLMQGLEEKWQEGQRLPENLVQMMVVLGHKYPATMAQQLRDRQQRQQRLQCNLIPSDNQRLARITHQKIQGSYGCLSPASTLFRHYGKLTRGMTLRFYHHELHLPVSRYHLHRVVPAQSLEAELRQSLHERFSELGPGITVLGLKALVANAQTHGQLNALQAELGQRLEAEALRAEGAQLALQEQHAELIEALTAEEIHLAGLWQVWGERRLRRDELEQLHQRARLAEEGYEKHLKERSRYLQTHARRLAVSLAGVIGRWDKPGQEVVQLLNILDRIERVAPQFHDLSIQTLLLELLLSFRGDRFNTRIKSRIEQRSSDIHTLLTAIGLGLKELPYPFRDSRQRRLMGYLLEESLSEPGPQGEMDRGLDVVSRLPLFHARLLVRLLDIAAGK